MLSRWTRRTSRLADRGRIVIRSLSLRDFDDEVARCNALYSEAFDSNWGFVKMSHAEFLHLAKQLKQFALPEWVLIAEVDGQPVGLSITIPDFNEATRPLDGRLTRFGLPIGALRLMRNLRRIRSGRLLVLAVLPEFRSRRGGVIDTADDRSRPSTDGRYQGRSRLDLGRQLEDQPTNYKIRRPALQDFSHLRSEDRKDSLSHIRRWPRVCRCVAS